MPRLLLTLCLLFVATLVRPISLFAWRVLATVLRLGLVLRSETKIIIPQCWASCWVMVRGQEFWQQRIDMLKNGDKPYWKQGEFKAASEFLPNIVVIKLGTNDSKPQNWKHKDQFAADLTALVEHFQALESKPKVYLCRPVPVYQDKWGINEKTVHDEVIPLIEKVASEKKLTVIDLHQALSDVKQHFPDGVHPNAAGAKLMAEAIHAALTKK